MKIVSMIALSAGLIAQTANAGVVLQQDFENTTVFPTGSALPFSSGDVATVGGRWLNTGAPSTDPMPVTTQARSGTQSILTTRGGGNWHGEHDGAGDNSAIVEASAYFYTASDSSIIFKVAHINNRNADTASAWISGGSVGALTSGGTAWDFSDGITIASDQWIGLKLRIDFSTVDINTGVGTYDVLIDSGAGFVLQGSGFDFNANAIGGDYNSVGFSPQNPTSNITYVDDALIETIPEPASLAMIGLGATVMVFRRRHRVG